MISVIIELTKLLVGHALSFVKDAQTLVSYGKYDKQLPNVLSGFG